MNLDKSIKTGKLIKVKEGGSLLTNEQINDLKRYTVERRIVSGTDDELFSGSLPFLTTQSERSDRFCAV